MQQNISNKLLSLGRMKKIGMDVSGDLLVFCFGRFLHVSRDSFLDFCFNLQLLHRKIRRKN